MKCPKCLHEPKRGDGATVTGKNWHSLMSFREATPELKSMPDIEPGIMKRCHRCPNCGHEYVTAEVHVEALKKALDAQFTAGWDQAVKDGAQVASAPELPGLERGESSELLAMLNSMVAAAKEAGRAEIKAKLSNLL